MSETSSVTELRTGETSGGPRWSGRRPHTLCTLCTLIVLLVLLLVEVFSTYLLCYTTYTLYYHYTVCTSTVLL